MRSFIARQPILDRYERVYGYELLYRPGGEEFWPPINGDGGGENASPGTPAFEGIAEITDGARVFIKCPRQALMGGHAAALPRDRVVLEVPAIADPDEEFLAACQKLKDEGFLIALENYQGVQHEPLADVANIIKLDVTVLTDRAQWLLIRKYRPKGTMFVADRVDKRTQFQAAVRQGFSYFQGQFFCRPEPCSTSDLPPSKLAYLLVLRAVGRPEIDVQEIANTIKHDLALSFKLLRFLNSPRFAFHSQIKSIRHALLLLGQNELRKWIGLVSVAALGEGAPPILVTMILIRAAFCESLAPLLGAPRRQSDYFFLGLLSSLDVLMGRPMRVLLAELPFPPDMSAALMGEQNSLREVLQVVISYEQGRWEECFQLAKKLALKEEKLSELYLQALRWSRELTTQEKDEPAQAPRP
jgi:EAL and modified HD-GYP domain-containing signal transduction protein